MHAVRTAKQQIPGQYPLMSQLEEQFPSDFCVWCQLILSIVSIVHAFHFLMYCYTQDMIVLAERNEELRFKQTQLVEKKVARLNAYIISQQNFLPIWEKSVLVRFDWGYNLVSDPLISEFKLDGAVAVVT